jgi:hypothetical protein
MCADERDGDKDADPRNDEKDQRDDKDEPIRCVQGHLTPDLVCDCTSREVIARRFPPPWSIEKAGRRIVWSLDCGPRWNRLRTRSDALLFAAETDKSCRASSRKPRGVFRGFFYLAAWARPITPTVKRRLEKIGT